MPKTLSNLEIAERIHGKLKTIPEVRRIEILPGCQANVDLNLRIFINPPRTWKVVKRIASALSEAKWEVFEETQELPAVEWEVVEDKD